LGFGGSLGRVVPGPCVGSEGEVFVRDSELLDRGNQPVLEVYPRTCEGGGEQIKTEQTEPSDPKSSINARKL
jgi:hypothetical protein